jgi:hypothetical protein
VSSLFPAEVRDRLFKHKSKKDKHKKNRKSIPVLASFPEGPKFRLKNYLNDETLGEDPKADKDAEYGSIKEKERDVDAPIADLFPEVTVMFADIAGFTAWSSVREPAQVFTLLETVYRSFDHIAKRRRVFKVET